MPFFVEKSHNRSHIQLTESELSKLHNAPLWEIDMVVAQIQERLTEQEKRSLSQNEYEEIIREGVKGKL